MLLPGCKRCGQCGCVCGTLPYTLTVTFAGLTNRAHSAHCELAFTSNFGCGAAAVGMLPGGCDDNWPDCGESNRGPLTSVLLTNGGHGYARTGRRQPVLSITGTGSGTGATFTPTLAAVDGTLAAQCRSYGLASVSISGGTGYTENEPLLIVADGETVTPAVAVLHLQRSEPDLAADVAGGTGAQLNVTVASNGDSPETWGATSVSVVAGGTGYPFTTYASTLPVTFATTGVTETAGTATAQPVVVEPDIEQAVWTDGGGSGFEATLALSGTTDNGAACFTVSGITITNAGNGYTVGDLLEIVAQDRDPTNGPTGVVVYTVATVDGSGAVTSVSAANVTEFFGACSGAILSVTVDSGGAYYASNGHPDTVEVLEPGEYFTEDPTAAICTADVTVNAVNCGGAGAQISATIGNDPNNAASYGRITGLTIDDGGDGYLCWHWVCDALAALNGKPIVLAAASPKRLVTIGVHSCFGSGACVVAIPKGPNIVCDGNTIASAYSGGASPIREIAVSSAGSGYARLGREQPQWTIAASGWTFTPTFGTQQTGDCALPYWPVESVAVTSGSATTQLDGWAMTHTLSHPEHADEYLSAVVHTRTAPTVTAAADNSGSGASFTVSVEEIGGLPKQWRVASISGGGGSGYADGASITFSVPQRFGDFGHYAHVDGLARATVNANGSITDWTILNGGIYWRDEGIPQSVEVYRGGRYYRENAALAPYVATVTATIDQLPPSSGSGAAISIAVNDDTSSPGFGTIGATLDSQGSGYTLLSGPTGCEHSASVWQCTDVGISAVPMGAGRPIELGVIGLNGASVTMWTDDPLGDCTDLPGTAAVVVGHPANATATLSAGGSIQTACSPPSWCGGCACPTDLLDAGTPVNVTSNIQCNGGNAGFNGNFGDFNFGCSWTDPATNTTYESDMALTIVCCDDSECTDSDPCIRKVQVTLSGALYLDTTPLPGNSTLNTLHVGGNTIYAQGGCTDTITIDPDTGEITGTVTVQVGQNTVTISL